MSWQYYNPTLQIRMVKMVMMHEQTKNLFELANQKYILKEVILSNIPRFLPKISTVSFLCRKKSSFNVIFQSFRATFHENYIVTTSIGGYSPFFASIMIQSFYDILFPYFIFSLNVIPASSVFLTFF